MLGKHHYAEVPLPRVQSNSVINNSRGPANIVRYNRDAFNREYLRNVLSFWDKKLNNILFVINVNSLNSSWTVVTVDVILKRADEIRFFFTHLKLFEVILPCLFDICIAVVLNVFLRRST
jgi:hypothetical protein